MKVIKDFSAKPLEHIRWWAWSVAVLPMTALSGLFFAWSIGLKSLLDIIITASATIMVALATVWWWWMIWVVSRILRKNRKVIIELQTTNQNIRDLKTLVTETFTQNDK